MQHASTTHCFNFAQNKWLQEDQVKFPGVERVGPADCPGGHHTLGNVGSWPALGVGFVCAHKGCEGWINHIVIQVTVLASLFTQVIRKTHLCPAQACGTAAFQACVACVVLDSGSDSKLFWFSSYELERDGITAHEMANSACLYPKARVEQMVAVCGPALFGLSRGWWCLCQKIVEHVRGNRGGVEMNWKEEAVRSRTWS